MNTTRKKTTVLLTEIRNGSRKAFDILYQRLYDELKAIARDYLKGERKNLTLQVTEIVNGAYLKLVRTLDNGGLDPRDKATFMSLVCKAMNHYLIDHARRNLAKKRGQRPPKLSLDDITLHVNWEPELFLSLVQAIERLSAIDRRQSDVVVLRYFADHSVDEVAGLLNTSPSSVERAWRLARAWLSRELKL